MTPFALRAIFPYFSQTEAEPEVEPQPPPTALKQEQGGATALGAAGFSGAMPQALLFRLANDVALVLIPFATEILEDPRGPHFIALLDLPFIPAS